jgi:hypothetical protein
LCGRIISHENAAFVQLGGRTVARVRLDAVACFLERQRLVVQHLRVRVWLR